MLPDCHFLKCSGPVPLHQAVHYHVLVMSILMVPFEIVSV